MGLMARQSGRFIGQRILPDWNFFAATAELSWQARLGDQAGSLIIIEAGSLEEAERIAQEDPYAVHGIFERVEVHPFQQVLPLPSAAQKI